MRPVVNFPPVSLNQLVEPARLAQIGVADLRATAVTDGTRTLDWQEYDQAIGRLATALVDAGVEPRHRVGIRLHKTVDSFVAVHAVIRIGAVMVPLDPLAPEAHASAVLIDASVSVLISSSGLAGAELIDRARIATVLLVAGDPVPVPVPAGKALLRVIGPDEIAALAAMAPVDVVPDDPAYIIYTSGSTGTPKGIVHTHRSAMAYAAAAVREYDLDRFDRLANIAPLHFDQSTFELYAAPLVGATVLVVPEPVLRFPASLSALIADHQITVWYSVPYLLAQLSTRGVLADRDLSSLRWVLFGGESFPPGQLAALMRQLDGVQFSNVYGPAEVNQCTSYTVPGPPEPDSVVPIGRAWSAAELRIVDPASGQPVAPGTPGVLLVATDSMMTGYWNRPDLTAAAIDTIVGTPPGAARWYRTGDLVVEQADGNVLFLGRIDNQVKLRGYRIELEAIDAVLRDIDVVAEGTCVVVRPVEGDDRLVALVEVVDADLERSDTLERIVAELRARLPKYSLPAEIRVVAELPRTGTGKVDRGRSLELVWT